MMRTGRTGRTDPTCDNTCDNIKADKDMIRRGNRITCPKKCPPSIFIVNINQFSMSNSTQYSNSVVGSSINANGFNGLALAGNVVAEGASCSFGSAEHVPARGHLQDAGRLNQAILQQTAATRSSTSTGVNGTLQQTRYHSVNTTGKENDGLSAAARIGMYKREAEENALIGDQLKKYVEARCLGVSVLDALISLDHRITDVPANQFLANHVPPVQVPASQFNKRNSKFPHAGHQPLLGDNHSGVDYSGAHLKRRHSESAFANAKGKKGKPNYGGTPVVSSLPGKITVHFFLHSKNREGAFIGFTDKDVEKAHMATVALVISFKDIDLEAATYEDFFAKVSKNIAEDYMKKIKSPEVNVLEVYLMERFRSGQIQYSTKTGGFYLETFKSFNQEDVTLKEFLNDLVKGRKGEKYFKPLFFKMINHEEDYFQPRSARLR